jgi:uncharacterized membrane protein HdeD (DUF308 family)
LSHSIEAAEQAIRQSQRWQRIRAAWMLVLGLSAMGGPLLLGGAAPVFVGVLSIVSGTLEWLQCFMAPDDRSRRAGYISGLLSILAGAILILAPRLATAGLIILLAGLFALEGFSKLSHSLKRRGQEGWGGTLAVAIVNLAAAAMILLQWPISGLIAVGFYMGGRIVAAGWSMWFTPPPPVAELLPEPNAHPDRGLALPSDPEFGRLTAQFEERERGQLAMVRYWHWTLVIVFFAIHIGRMRVDLNLVGMIGPAVAVLGDVALAILIAFGIVLPYRIGWRRLTRRVERKCWRRRLPSSGAGVKLLPGSWLVRRWLERRMGFAWRLRQARQSPRAALRWGLTVGLPAVAVLIALNPIWGFSWYFNSENWAAEIWNHWAEERADAWREAMVRDIRQHYLAQGMKEEQLFRVEPEGINGSGDFSFIVIGDTGEGDASQHVLRDQLLLLGRRRDPKLPEVQFLVVSSDVIYPSGAMFDYESKFYLPFKGFTKPIYAIPGNHDWFDALEGFNANFLERDAARLAMRARINADGRLTTTRESRIDSMIAQAQWLREQYEVRTGKQRGPFFEVQTERFALIAVDTGVKKAVDDLQWNWLKDALTRARGKFIMVLLGHPLYAGGHYQAADGSPFQDLHKLLREHRVHVVMGGDTHDLEYYEEAYSVGGQNHSILHFVNGGGGAYLSIGTALDWPTENPVANCAHYPRADALRAKFDAQTPLWKMPIWLWVKHLKGWPSTVEGFAGAFDFNAAPFFQSFVEVRVLRSTGEVKLLPYGVNGQLSWRDMQTFGKVIPEGKTAGDFVEFTVKLPR